MGIFQYECMILAATPPQNVGCERCIFNVGVWGGGEEGLAYFIYFMSLLFHCDRCSRLMSYTPTLAHIGDTRSIFSGTSVYTLQHCKCVNIHIIGAFYIVPYSFRCRSKFVSMAGSCVDQAIIIGVFAGVGGALFIGLIICVIILGRRSTQGKRDVIYRSANQ